MFNTFDGIPAHPLLVHIPVVLVPLAMVGVVLMAIRGKWLRTFGLFVAGLAGVGFLGALLAANSGEALEDTRRSAGETISATLSDHGEMGDTAQVLIGIFFALALVWVLFSRWQRRVGEERATAVVRKPRLVGIVFTVLAVVSGAVATV
ncbi:MAG: DUF2231 domain-containing protein, partial [Ilumatobacteraceae bacterium]